jgi:L-aminopeptidase/D-esterase-like protein
MHDDITDIPGIRVGHDTNLDAGTGCTVVLCTPAAVGGVDVRGGAPATREIDLLRPMHMVNEVNAILLTGGSAFGLDAASGVVRYLEEQDIGYDTGVARVPIVPAAAIFDLALGSSTVRPDAAAGYGACQNATSEEIAQGTVGAGTGATVAKTLLPVFAVKGGLGSASTQLDDGTRLGALVVVNAFGNILDPQTGQFIAVSRDPLTDTLSVNTSISSSTPNPFGNTTIAIVATTASLTKEEINKVAQMAQNGLAQSIRPAHTMFDGDTVFALSMSPRTPITPNTGERAYLTSRIGWHAAETLARAIVKAIRAATTLHGIPSVGTY